MSRDLFLHYYTDSKLRPVLVKIINEQLAENTKEYFIDYYIKGYSQKFIAQKYGTSQATISQMTNKAADKVMRYFKYCLEVENGKTVN